MKLRRAERGFTFIEVLLVTIILAIIGGAGYYVYHAQHETSKTAEATKVSNPINQGGQNQVADGWFEFKEFGVKIKLSGLIKNLKASIEENEISKIRYVTITTTEIEQLATSCAQARTSVGYYDTDATVAVIGRYEGNYQEEYDARKAANDSPSFPSLLKQFNGFYISIGNPTDDQDGDCMDTPDNEKYRASVDAVKKDLFKAFKDAEEIK